MPTLSTHVTDELEELIRTYAEKHYRGKVSAVIADLLESKFLHSKPKQSPMTDEERKTLADLAKSYAELKKTVDALMSQKAKEIPKPTKKKPATVGK
jgi:ribosome recycling factor